MGKNYFEKDGKIIIPVTKKIVKLGELKAKDWYNLSFGYKMDEDERKIILRQSFPDNFFEKIKNIVILKDVLFNTKDIGEGDIIDLTKKEGFSQSESPVLAFVLREIFSDEMISRFGLCWITCMHNPPVEVDGLKGRYSVNIDDPKISVKYNKQFKPGHGFAVVG